MARRERAEGSDPMGDRSGATAEFALDPGIVRRLRGASRAVAVAVAALGAIVLLGWILDVPRLKSVLPGWVTMKANTAICFCLLGGALAVLPRDPGPRVRRAARAAAGVTLAVGLLTLSEYASGWDLGIDQALFREGPTAVGTSHPGRMSPVTALSFVLLGAALLREGRGLRRGDGWLELGASSLGLFSLIGYLYDVPKLYGIATYTQIAAHTSLAITLLGLAALVSWPERGPLRVLASDGAGGVLARRFLPLALILPAALGWVRMAGQRAGLYPTELGLALMVLATIVILVWFGVRSATLLQTGHEERTRQLAELARLATELSLRSRQLEEANRELESFSYSASHDLRAPLRAIDGFSRVLHDRYEAQLDAEGRDYLGRVRAAAQRMGQIIDDLLRLSRLSRQELNPVPLDLAELARRVVGTLRAGEPARTVDVRIPDSLPARGDPQLVEVVLQNLLGNAWKFTGRTEAAWIELGSRILAGSPAFYVRDNGAGFDPEFSDRLFRPFQRLHGVAEFPGTGIGLATVQRIVHRHGGRVWAEGETGRGATLFFTLAATTPPPRPDGAEKAS